MVFKRKLIKDIPYLLLAVLIIFFLCNHSPNLELDTDPSYILFGASRPPLYPIFIWLFHWSGIHQFSLVMWAQGILMFCVLLYARYWLRKNLLIPDFLIFIVSTIVILTISLHFQIWFIQSEGLSFPFFIWTFFVIVECVQQFNLKKLFYLACLVSILVLTRLQFYYFYIIFAMLSLWYLRQNIPHKKNVLATSILFGSMMLTILIDHSYHYFKHGFFAGSPYGGLMVMVQTLYLADDNAADYFKNPVEKSYMQKMIKQRNFLQLNKDASLLKYFKPSYYQYAYQTYYRNYLPIQKIIDDTLNTNVENISGTKTNFNANLIAVNIDKILIRREIKKNLLFFLWKFIQCMGGIPMFLFFLIIFLASTINIIKKKTKGVSMCQAFVMVVTIITFLNSGIIAACNPDLPVYFCYSEFMFYCLAALLVTRTFYNDGVANSVYLKTEVLRVKKLLE